MRDESSSDIVLQDVMRIQVERLRLECEELRSDYEALFNERKALQSLVNRGGNDDNRQLAVELAHAHDSLAALKDTHSQLQQDMLRKEHELRSTALELAALRSRAAGGGSRSVWGGGQAGSSAPASANPFASDALTETEKHTVGSLLLKESLIEASLTKTPAPVLLVGASASASTSAQNRQMDSKSSSNGARSEEDAAHANAADTLSSTAKSSTVTNALYLATLIGGLLLSFLHFFLSHFDRAADDYFEADALSRGVKQLTPLTNPN
jgi:hypothetical protein